MIRFFILSILLVFSLSAQPIKELQNFYQKQPLHFPLNSRPLNLEEKASLKDLRVEQSDEKTLPSDQKLSDPQDYPLPYAPSQHSLAGLSPSGDVLELEDGSTWGLYFVQASQVLDWSPQDALVISINSDSDSNAYYPYILFNLTQGSQILSKLLLAPYYESPHSRWISEIDLSLERIILNDGTSVFLSIYDLHVLKYWEEGDSLIIALNQDWLSWANPYTLINTATETYVRGDL